MRKILVIGAGPAGLTAAHELLAKSADCEVTVFEESEAFGGISRTAVHNGNRMDMGGHRLFSKVPEVNEWWERMLPMQGAPAQDDILLGRDVPLADGGPDPERESAVMLLRRRVSRILFDANFFDYPVSLSLATLRNLGLFTTVRVGFSYLHALLHRLPETNLENFYINRFGRALYELFFEHYTENLWGRHPREIDASWGAQRVKGLSVAAVLRDILAKILGRKKRTVETSLIGEFKYPKLGPGQLWDITAEKVRAMGGTIVTGARVVALRRNGTGAIRSLVYEKDGRQIEATGDIVVSSMPIQDLVAGMDGVPVDIARIAAGLPYRDYMTLGVLVRKLRLRNETRIRTVGNIVPDCWVYVQDRGVRMGRFQIYNNWSPYLVRDLADTVWLGLEYFVSEGDELWRMAEEDFAALGIGEMLALGLIESRDDVLDTHLERVKKAYPAYFDTYAEMDTLRAWLDGIPNLWCVGRNGQHRYNNIDHSMMTSFRAAAAILAGSTDKSSVWNVNTEEEYHEGK